jgi:tetratricopeptide (TPR) repeat protein
MLALLTAYPRDLLPALTKVCGELPNAAPLVRLLVIAADNCALNVLPLVAANLPDDGRGLSPLALTVYGRQIDATIGMADESLARRIAWSRSLSLHQEHLGRHDDALRTNQDAITECRVLRGRGERWPEMFARLHGDRALFLLRRGEIADALANGSVAVEEYRVLGAAYTLSLADVLHNQDILYAKAGRLLQALDAGEQALRLYGDDYGPRRSRAAARLQVSEDLADLGRIPEALRTSTAGVEILQELFSEAPSTYAADLMRALSQHAMVLQDAREGLEINKLPGADEHLVRARAALDRALQASLSLPAPEPDLLTLVHGLRRVLEEG